MLGNLSPIRFHVRLPRLAARAGLRQWLRLGHKIDYDLNRSFPLAETVSEAAQFFADHEQDLRQDPSFRAEFAEMQVLLNGRSSAEITMQKDRLRLVVNSIFWTGWQEDEEAFREIVGRQLGAPQVRKTSRQRLSIVPGGSEPPLGLHEEETRGREQCFTCFQTNPSAAKYCMHCGDHLPKEEQPLPYRRTRATILHCDMKSLLPLASELEPLRLADARDSYFKQLGECVFSQGGHWIPQGDEALAIFEAGEHEDHALRAVDTALLMRQMIQSHDAGRSDDIRFAIHTGTVAVGRLVSPDGRHLRFQSEDVDVTQDMLQAVPRGELWLTAVTLLELKERYALEARGPVAGERSETALDTYAVMGKRPTDQRIHPRGDSIVPLQERQAELNVLQRAADSAWRHRERFVYLMGEPGIGKTRLATELLKTLPAEVRSIQVRGVKRPAHPLYYVVADILRELAAFRPEDSAQVMESKLRNLVSLGIAGSEEERELPLHLLANLMSVSLQGLPVEVQEDLQRLERDEVALREQSYDAVMRVLDGYLVHQPLAITIEDLHWADIGSLRILHAMQQRVRGRRLYLQGLARPELTRYFPDLLSDVEYRDSRVLEVNVESLSSQGLRRMARDLLSDDEAAYPESMIDFLVTQSNGNPFFLEEHAKAAKMGMVQWDEHTQGWKIRDAARKTLAPTTDNLLREQINTLLREHPEAQEMLRLTAVLGEEFTLETLRALKVNQPGLLIASLMSEKVFVETHSSRYAYRHGLWQEAIYDMISPDERRRLHRVVAAYYEAAPDKSHPVIAAHYEAAGDWQRAAQFYFDAGESLKAGEFSVAAAFFDKAYQLRRQSDSSAESQMEALLLRCDRLHTGGLYRDMRELLQPLDEVSERIPRSQGGLWASYYHYKGLIHDAHGESDEAMVAVEAGLNFVAPREASVLRSRLLNLKGSIHWFQRHEFEAARESFAAALEAAQVSGDPYHIAKSRNNLAGVVVHLGDYSGAITHGLAAVDAYREQENEAALLSAINNAASALMGVGEYDKALALFEEGLGLSRNSRLKGTPLPLMLLGLGEASLRDERRSDAIQYLKEALALYKELPKDYFMAGVVGTFLAQAYLGQGERKEALVAAMMVQTIGRDKEDITLKAMAHMLLAQIRQDEGRLDDAYRESLQAMGLLYQPGVDRMFESEILLTHAELLLERDKIDEARKVILHARTMIDERAAQITDTQHKERYLTRVPTASAIMRLSEELSARQISGRTDILARLREELEYYPVGSNLPSSLSYVDPSVHRVDLSALNEDAWLAGMAHDPKGEGLRSAVVVNQSLASLFASLYLNRMKLKTLPLIGAVDARDFVWEPQEQGTGGLREGRLRLLWDWKLGEGTPEELIDFIGNPPQYQQWFTGRIFDREGSIYIDLSPERESPDIPEHLRVSKQGLIPAVQIAMVPLSYEATILSVSIESARYFQEAAPQLLRALVENAAKSP